MNFKPNEFFVVLVELITILLPGAVEANHPVKANHAVYHLCIRRLYQRINIGGHYFFVIWLGLLYEFNNLRLVT